MQKDITTFFQHWVTCNITKTSHQCPAGLLQSLLIPQYPWFYIAIDFITEITLTYRFSNACHLIPHAKLLTAFETAEALLEQVFGFYELPEDIVSDHWPQFTTVFCQKLNINVSLPSGYHPQSNDQVERLNQELTNFLHSLCHSNQNDRSPYILWAEYSQNSLRKPSTCLTPFQCELEFQPPLFPWSGEPSELPATS